MRTYTINPGDTLGAIANSHGTTLQAILASNPQITNPDLIYAGSTLNLSGLPESEISSDRLTRFNQATQSLSTSDVGEPCLTCPGTEKTATITVLIELPRSDAETLPGRKGLDGHTAIAIDDEFYDFGPTYSEFDSPGRPWWDKIMVDADLKDKLTKVEDVDLKHALKLIEDHVIQDVYSVTLEVAPDEAKAVEKWWLDRYKNIGTYSVFPWTGEQCTTTVRISLEKAGVITQSSTQTPEGLLDFLRDNAKHTAGAKKGKPAKIEQIQHESSKEERREN